MIKLLSPYIIAEIGINHEGKLGYIKKLIKQAKEAAQMLLNSKLLIQTL